VSEILKRLSAGMAEIFGTRSAELQPEAEEHTPALRLFELRLSERVDGTGMLYGDATLAGRSVRINLLPPGKFMGDAGMMIEEPHATGWRIFIDGDEVATASHWDGVEPAIRKAMAGEDGR
jgi:hypothetical protein